MRGAIISIGTELTTGACVDTNAAWLAVELTRRGVAVVRHVTVGDDASAIADAMRGAVADADVVICTGGIGPTPDDRTRCGAAQALNVPLEEHPAALAQVRAFFERWQRPMSARNRTQALIPAGCSVLPNARGTAPGFWHDGDAARLFVLPGVPVEMKAMFAQAVAPLVDPGGGVGAGGVGSCARVARLLTFGASEARVGDMLADMMAAERNPSLGTTASGAVITVRIVAYGRDAATADRLVDGDVAEVRRRLGHAVFGADEDTLQDAVARLLIAQGRTIATAESCTGGLLAKRLTDVPGASGYFLRGVVAYANDAKTALLGVPGDVIASEGAVSEAVARAMADGCRRLAGSDLAVSITGIAGPDGGSPPDRPVGLVYIGVADRDGVAVRRFVFGSHLTRAEVRDRSCKTALNLVRLQLLDAAPT